MKIALLIDFLLIILLGFLGWLFPGIGRKSRELCEEWWIAFSDLEPRRIGSYVAGLISHRMDVTFGSLLVGKRFLVFSFLFSQVIFILCFLWIALAYGLIELNNWSASFSQLKVVASRLSHCILPLLVINTVFDMISLSITREILRKAAKCEFLIQFWKLIGLDSIIAMSLVFLSALVFSNFYFCSSMLLGILIFLALLGFVPVLIMAFVGIFIVRVDEEMSKGAKVATIIFFSLISTPVIVLAIKNQFYIPYLNFDFTDISVILVLAVSFSAALPTFLNLITLFFMFILRSFSAPTHTALSHVLLRIAETKKGILLIMIVVLATLKDLLTILLTK